MSLGNTWNTTLNFTTTQLPPPSPPHPPPLLHQQRDLPSNYMYVPHTEIPQSYYIEDPRLAHKLNCVCRFGYNLLANNSLQPAATEPVKCETGTSSPAQNIPVSPPPPRKGATAILNGLSPSLPEQRDTLLPSNGTQNAHGRITVPTLLTTIYCSRPNFLIPHDQDLCKLTCINTVIRLLDRD
jgi:hypothetical protein